MGNKLFGIDISGLVKKHIAPGLNTCVLTKITPGTRTAGNLAGGTKPTTANYAARGLIGELDQGRRENSLVRDGDLKILVVGDSVASGIIPAPGDQVTILGGTYNLIIVEVDPAKAVFVCTARSN